MHNTEIEYLTWDSNFFKKKIGQIFVENSDNLENILEKAKNKRYQLIYVFGNKFFFIDDKVLKRFNGKLVDKKVLFEKSIEMQKEQPEFIFEYKNDELVPELEQLAYESGKYSRFKLDSNFGKNDFYRMYKVWIENSINKQIADNVFVAIENNVIKGMATLKIAAGKGQIGLIAVSPEAQGKGYGKMLITACENGLLRKNISKIEVSTQVDNIQSCKFYEKCSFKIKETSNVYHFWI